MKRYFFIVLITCGLTVYGQDFMGHIMSMSEVTVDTSIVRSVRPDVCVVYTSSQNAGNHFHVVNTLTKVVHSFSVTQDVKDVEVLDDTVFFCGINYYPILGFFAVNDVSSGNVGVTEVRYSTPQYVVPKRLELFRTDDGLHVVTVGDYAHVLPANSFICDAWRYNGTPSFWNAAVLLTQGKEMYDDITVTDNYVVASANAYTSSDIILRVFHRPMSAVNSYSSYEDMDNNIFYGECPLLSTSCPNIVYYYAGDYPRANGWTGKYPIRIVHTHGDKMALSCMSFKNSVDYGLTIKEIGVVSGVPVVMRDYISLWGGPLATGWDMREMRYDAVRDTLILLMDKAWPFSTNLFKESMIGRVFFPTASSVAVSAPSLSVAVPVLHSLDAHVNKNMQDDPLFWGRGAVCSGFSNLSFYHSPLVWNSTHATGPCTGNVDMNMINGVGKMEPADLPSRMTILTRCMRYTGYKAVTVGELDVMCMAPSND